MIHVDVCEGGRSVTRGVGAERIGEHLARPERLLWVDVASPTDADWDRLTAEFGFHPLAVEDAKQRSERPKMNAYAGFLFLSVRTWTGDRSRTADLDDATEEIDVFLGQNYLVTAHAAAVPLIEEMRRRWEEHPERLDPSPSTLLHVLLDTIVDNFFPAMDQIDADIDSIEMRAYAPDTGQDPADLAAALVLKKRLLLLRQVVVPMRDILNQLLRADNHLIPARERAYYQDVYDHALRLVEQIDLHRDILGGVMDAVMAQTNNRLNQIMKTLTAISTSLMTASLIAGIYGMNFKNMPELNWLYGYPAALLLMVVVVGGLLAYFRRIKWL